MKNLAFLAKPDIYIGHNSDNIWAAKRGVSILPIYGTNSIYVWYAGAYDIARRIKRQFKNPAFNGHLAANVRQPYRESWYSQYPFKYIKGGEAI